MIVFLTLVYIALLLMFFKLKVIQPTLGWKLSPIAWMLLLLIALFIPMQWGAPSGPVGVFRNVIEIVPAVSGQVTEVPIQPLVEVDAGEVLFQIDPEPFQDEVGRLTAALAAAEQQPELLQSSVDIAEASLSRTTAERELAARTLERNKKLVESSAVSKQEYEESLRSAVVAERAEKEAELRLAQAKLELASVTADGENTAVAQAREQLARAKYDLNQATVRAPTRGEVQQLALRPGTRVAAMPLRGSLTFIETDRSRIAVAIQQNQLRYVQPGQDAEVVLKYLPGQTLSAKVVGIADVTSGGQVQSSGVIEDLTAKQTRAEPLQVVLELDGGNYDANELPGGAVGIAAIYTEEIRFAHIIRRVMLRMKAWTNYVW
ncbi:MAG: HlyD family secretion protein [Rhodopirellula sp. JB044]|uniref:HlyD family secretion protein n=1 Tax=Rhodopirellula sp. JB044 TaxID=3342844 RepID=UPI00370AA0B9